MTKKKFIKWVVMCLFVFAQINMIFAIPTSNQGGNQGLPGFLQQELKNKQFSDQVGNTGDLSFSLDLCGVSVSYSSADNGCWSIANVSRIKRSTKYGVPRYREQIQGQSPPQDDVFEFDGLELVCETNVNRFGYGVVRRYHTERQNFLKIEYFNPGTQDSYWKVTDKEGTYSYYGKSADSRIERLGEWPLKKEEPRVWAITQTRDAGNYNVTYYKYGLLYTGNYYLTRVIQGKVPKDNEAVKYTCTAIFYSAYAQSGASISFAEGAKVFDNQKPYVIAKGVACDNSGNSQYSTFNTWKNYTVVPQWFSLKWETAPYTEQLRLTSITENGNDSNINPSYVFDYYDMAPGFDSTMLPWKNPNPENQIGKTDAIQEWSGHDDVKSMFMDINGDGLPDRCRKDGEGAGEPLRVWLNTGRGFKTGAEVWYKPSSDYLRDFVIESGPYSFTTKTDFFDINGDFLPDRVIKKMNKPLQVLENKGFPNGNMAFELNEDWKLNSQHGGTALHHDHRYDYRISGDLYHMSGGTACTFLDMNNDRLADRVRKGNETPILSVMWNKRYAFSGWSWSNLPDNYAIRQFSIKNDKERRVLGTFADFIDINGDGLPDRLLKNEDGGFIVYLNRGNGTFEENTLWGQNLMGKLLKANKDDGETIADLIDMNGDGLPDRVKKDRYEGFQVWLNKGNGFSTEPVQWNGQDSYAIYETRSHEHYAGLMDMDGDGILDRYVKGEKEPNTRGGIWRNHTLPSELFLKSVTNPMGGIKKYTYHPLKIGPDSSNPRYPVKKFVVTNISLQNGYSIETTGYSYSGGVFDYAKGENRGFETVIIQEPDFKVTEIHYYTDEIKAGFVKKKILRSPNEKGPIFSYEYYQYTEQNNPLARGLRQNVSAVGSWKPLIVRAPLLYKTDTYLVDGATNVDSGTCPDGRNYQHSCQSTTYDYFGNPTGIQDFIYDSDGNSFLMKNKKIQYEKNTEKWIFMPKQVESYSRLLSGEMKLSNKICYEYNHFPSSAVEPVVEENIDETSDQVDNQIEEDVIEEIEDVVDEVYEEVIEEEIDEIEEDNSSILYDLNNSSTFGTKKSKSFSSIFANAEPNIVLTSLGDIIRPIDDNIWTPEVTPKPTPVIEDPDDNFSEEEEYIETPFVTKKIEYIIEIHPREDNPEILIEKPVDESIVEFKYDKYGNRWKESDSLKHWTEYAYDNQYHSLLIEIKNPPVDGNGFISRKSYDEYMRLEKETDVNGNSTVYVYDDLGRLQKKIKPYDTHSNPTEYYTYGIGKQKGMSWFCVVKNDGTSDGWQTWYYLDGFGKLVQSKTEADDENGNRKWRQVNYWEYIKGSTRIKAVSAPLFSGTWQYENMSNIHQLQGEIGYEISYLSNSNNPGRIAESITFGGHKTVKHFFQNTSLVTDANGKTKKKIIDPINLSTVIIEYNNGETYITKIMEDAFQRRVVDNQNNTTITCKDSLGRKVMMIDPDMGTWKYEYDNNGNLINQRNEKKEVVTMSYDPQNRLLLKTYPDGTNIKYYYDGRGISTEKKMLGYLTRVDDTSGDTRMHYDNRGRVFAERKYIKGLGAKVTRFKYNSMDRIRAIQYPDDNFYAEYAFNNGGEVKGLRANGKIIMKNVFYNRLGKVVEHEFGNNATTSYSYYNASQDFRLSSLKTFSIETVERDPVPKNKNEVFYKTRDNISLSILPPVITPDPIPLPTTRRVDHLNYNYSYDNVGNIMSIVDNLYSGTRYFEYDDLYRLTRQTNSSYPGGNENFSYDSIGNLKSKNGINYFYGDGSNNSSTTAGPHAVTGLSTGTTFIYDKNGNMIQRGSEVLRYDYENRLMTSANGSYIYDYQGNRVRKIENGKTCYYVNKYFEIRDNLTVRHYYVNGLKIAENRNGQWFYYHNEHLDGTNVVTNEKASLVSRLFYNSYGETVKSQGSLNPDYQYTGKEKDNTGLYYYGARYYDPSLARFIQADTIYDPMGGIQGLNRYSYTVNNPIRYNDPTGHQSNSSPPTNLAEYYAWKNGGGFETKKIGPLILNYNNTPLIESTMTFNRTQQSGKGISSAVILDSQTKNDSNALFEYVFGLSSHTVSNLNKYFPTTNTLYKYNPKSNAWFFNKPRGARLTFSQNMIRKTRNLASLNSLNNLFSIINICDMSHDLSKAYYTNDRDITRKYASDTLVKGASGLASIISAPVGLGIFFGEAFAVNVFNTQSISELINQTTFIFENGKEHMIIDEFKYQMGFDN